MADAAPKKVVEVALGVLVREVGDGTREVFISRRRNDALLGGYWEFPGGKIEPGETARGAVEREFEEEVGLGVTVGPLLAVVEHAYEHGRVKLHAYWCVHRSGEPVNRGVQAHRWVTCGELATCSFPPANAPLVEAIRRALGHGASS
jgi:mutator protein MutT